MDDIQLAIANLVDWLDAVIISERNFCEVYVNIEKTKSSDDWSSHPAIQEARERREDVRKPLDDLILQLRAANFRNTRKEMKDD